MKLTELDIRILRALEAIGRPATIEEIFAVMYMQRNIPVTGRDTERGSSEARE